MGRWPAFFSHWASLQPVVILTEPCRPDIRMTEAGGVAAEDVDEFVVDDLYDLFGRGEGGGDLFADGAGADALDELGDDSEVDVGLEEGEANLAEGVGDVLVRDCALAAEGLEGALEFVA